MKLKTAMALIALLALLGAACGSDDTEAVADLEADLAAAQAAAAAAEADAAEAAAEAAAAEAAAEAAAAEAAAAATSTAMDQVVDIRAALNADLDNCAPAPSGDPIRVGMAMDFSDVVGFVDIPGSKLVPHFANLINCTGGVDGSPVEVRVEDVGGDANTAGVAAATLLDWGAHFIIGPPFADFTLPILQATGGQVPVFVAASTEPTLSDIENNSFLVTFDDRGQSTAALSGRSTRASPGPSCSPSPAPTPATTPTCSKRCSPRAAARSSQSTPTSGSSTPTSPLRWRSCPTCSRATRRSSRRRWRSR